MTHDTAVASARSAANAYANAWLARRRAYEQSRADGPGRADDVAIECIRDATQRAFREFLDCLSVLYESGGEAQAVSLILDVQEVQDRTEAARTPVAIPVNEGGA